MYFLRFNMQNQRYTVLSQGDMVDGKDDVIKRHQTASHIFPHWIVAE